ncbi:hypothetical protein SHIRM173S_13032 [Streptomyces hirsutus]
MSPNGSDRSPRRPMRRKLLQALTAGLVLATATGCTWEDFPRLGMPTPTTEEAPLILSLWQGSWAAALAIGALVWGLILWSVFFHRRSRTKVEVPPQTSYNMPIEALYTMVPLIIVSVLFYFTALDESELINLDESRTSPSTSSASSGAGASTTSRTSRVPPATQRPRRN